MSDSSTVSLVSVFIPACASFGGALLAILVTPSLQHYFWKSQRREELRLSLRNPHPESADLAQQGLEEWTRGLPEEDTGALLDNKSGKPVQWISGEGWVQGSE